MLYRDTACSSYYDDIRPLHYVEADIFMICFSIDNPQSYQNAINKWLYEVDRYAKNS
jgi:GTPase SAR1 family protein